MTSQPQKPSNTLTPFYGVSVARIAEWCMVSQKTALKYKNGTLLPSRRSIYLFNLHKNNKILGKEWGDWIVRGDKLYSPTNEEFGIKQLEAHQFYYQIAKLHAPKEVYKILAELSAS